MLKWKVLVALTAVFITTHISAAFLPPVQSKQGMIVSSQRLASLVGQHILHEGGNAVDAAVAVGYALAVVHPCCGNLGGGGFMTIHLRSGKNVFINFRETAPANIKPALFLKDGKVDRQLALHSYLAVGVPGTVMGLNTALKKFGSLSLQQVMAPAIKLAKQGFILSHGDVNILRRYTDDFRKQPNVAAIFLPNGQPLQVGQRLKQPQLAHTLEAISEQGSRVFYHGWIAQEIVQAAQKDHGVLSMQDFVRYKVHVEKPLECHYRGDQILTGPPPSSGVIICEILKTLQAYPLKNLGFHSALATHLNAEAMRFAFYDRNHYLGDPRFVKNPLKQLLSAEHIHSIRQQIKPFFATPSSQIKSNIQLIANNPNTTHYSIMDAKGNAVAVTYTLNGLFGNKRIAGKTGFFLNNELDDFAIVAGAPNLFKLVQGKANLIAPNKQPLSSMSPTIVMKNNKVYMVLGAAGGSTIITSIVQAIENVVDFGMNINMAINQPRFHMQWLPDKIYYEPFALSADTQATLRKMGYQLQLGAPYHTKRWGQMAAIRVNPKTGAFEGANDNRRPAGLAVG